MQITMSVSISFLPPYAPEEKKHLENAGIEPNAVALSSTPLALVQQELVNEMTRNFKYELLR